MRPGIGLLGLVGLWVGACGSDDTPLSGSAGTPAAGGHGSGGAGHAGMHAGRSGASGIGGSGDAGTATSSGGDDTAGTSSGGNASGATSGGGAGVDAGAAGFAEPGSGEAGSGEEGGGGAGDNGGEVQGCESLSCLNGGTCSEDWRGAARCSCTASWFGAACENPRFVALDAGDERTCGIRPDGVAQCWGDAAAIPPTGALTSISTSELICGLKSDHTASCGPSPWHNGLDPSAYAAPPGTFEQVVASEHSACGVHSDGTVECWGETSARPIAGEYAALAHYDGAVSCAVRANGSATCWGNSINLVGPAAVQHFALSTGGKHACRRELDESVACWGDDSSGQASPPALAPGSRLTAGDAHSCALSPKGAVTCWGSNDRAQSAVPANSYNDIAAGDGFTCTARPDTSSPGNMRFECWGDFPNRMTIPSQLFGTYHPGSLVAGGGHACFLDGGTARCFGDDSRGQATPPAGSYNFVALAAGGAHTCGLATDHTLACWGSNDSGQATAPPGTFAQVAAGADHSCALDFDWNLVCWGSNALGQASPPPGKYLNVSAGGAHTCALRSDGAIVCFGDASAGQLVAPAAPTFVEIAQTGPTVCGIRAAGSGFCGDGSHSDASDGALHGIVALDVMDPNDPNEVVAHACALRADDTPACWGPSGPDLTTPPSGAFQSVTLGAKYGCGLRFDGSVTCWGSSQFGAHMPPYGRFQQVSSEFSACGLRMDGSVLCWEQNDPFAVLPDTDPTYAGPATSVAVGGWGISWLDPDGSVQGKDQLFTPGPEGTFVELAQAQSSECGLTADGHVVCDPDITPPDGTFTTISGGMDWYCGLRASGSVECWPGPFSATPSPFPTAPSEPLTAISVGIGHACGLRADQSILCWPPDPSSPPSGPVKAVVAGTNEDCALHLDGTAECWASSYFGSASAPQPSGTFETIGEGCGIRPGGIVSCWGAITR